jgi:hypothetical protein
VADLPAAQTTYSFTGRGNGTFQYRVRGLYTVTNGLFAGPASAVKTVVVDRRLEADVTSMIEARMVDGSLSLSGGVFQFNQTLKNISGDTSIFSPLKMIVTSVTSNSGNVRVKNADDGGNGVSSPATFDYTSQVGSDQRLAPGETSGSRQLQFNNPMAEMFQFTVVVRGHLPDSAGAAGSGGTSGGGAEGSGSEAGSSSSGGTTSGTSVPGSGLLGGTTLRFTVNPLTKSVSLVR